MRRRGGTRDHAGRAVPRPRREAHQALRLASALTLELSEAARQLIAREGYDPVYGARPLRRFIQREVETRAAQALLSGAIRDGATIELQAEDDELVVAWRNPEAEPSGEPVGPPLTVVGGRARPTGRSVTMPPPTAEYDRLRARHITRLGADRVLFQRYRDPHDPLDREEMVERFLPLARQLAARYVHTSEPFDDLYQVACVGLVCAIDRYDVDRGAAFSSFAVPTILGELKRYFRDKTWAVRVPRELQDIGLKAHKAAERLSCRLGRQPTVGELAGELGLGEEAVLEARDAMEAYRPTSLAAPRALDEGNDETVADSLGWQETGFQRAEQRAMLDRLLRRLTLRQREVIRLRFEEDLTQQAIADRVGMSQMQVSRVLRDALELLRRLPGAEEREALVAA